MTGPVQVFDGHNDTILKLELASRRGVKLDFAPAPGTPDRPAPKTEREWLDHLDIDLPRARDGGFAGGLFAMFVPSDLRRIAGGRDGVRAGRYAAVPHGAALEFTLAMMARMRRLVRELPDDLAWCRSGAEARAAMAGGRIAVVPHVEGAECIDNDMDSLEILHAAGLASLGLVWSRANAFGVGAPMREGPDHVRDAPLTPIGRVLVAECERLGILVDLSHLNEGGFWDVARIATRPLIASHSNVHALSPTPRNLTDKQLHAVAESGGLVGLNFNCSFLREDCRDDRDTPVETMIRHLDHMLSILGEDGVALGSDYDGCLLPAEIGDVTGLPVLVEAMAKAGYGAPLIAKIARENWLRALDRAAA